jgi:hypothetical protein
MSTESQLAAAALDTLHGARDSLPPKLPRNFAIFSIRSVRPFLTAPA